MADISDDILKQLQQHSLQPPSGAFEKAWKDISLQKKTVVPPAEKQVFGELQGYSIAPPDLDFKAILAGKKAAEKKPGFVISKPLLRAAAVLIVAAAGAGIFFVLPHSENPAISYINPQTKKPETINNQGAAGILDSGEKTSVNNNAAFIKTVAASNTVAEKIGRETAKSKNYKAKKAAIKNKSGGSMQWYSNDVFFTLVNYKDYGKEKLFNKAIADKTIILSKYSYLNISDKMAAMLQEIYLTKKNGKPARKAKKAKKKFDKWRKNDENYFDKKIEKNPIDIIDLSDFLIDN